MTSTSLESHTLADEAYARIRGAMHEHRLQPGQKLRFIDLQKLTETSVTPVREALVRLTAEGFTEMEGHRGYRVAPISSADFQDVQKNRQMLEGEALRQSILHGDEHWEANLVSAHHLLSHMERGRADLPTALDDRWERQHMAFHEALIAACQSKVLLGFCKQLSARASRYRRLSVVATPGVTRNIPEQHRQIFEATLKRNANLAAALLQQHYDDTARQISMVLGERPSR